MNEMTKVAGFCLSNKVYDFIKFLTVVFLPALGTLYFALSQMWGLPAGEAVLGTMMAVQVFIAAIIGISTKQYEESGAKYVGEINVTDTIDKTVFSLDYDGDPEELKDKKEAVFKINPPKKEKPRSRRKQPL